MLRILLSAALALLVAAPALADVVVLKDGSRREGRVVRQNDDEVVLEVALGSLKAELILKRSEIASVEKGATANEKLLAEVTKRRGALRPGDKAGWLTHAEWLDTLSGFSREAREAYEKVLELDGENEAARRRLGYRRVGGQWMTEEEIMLAKGYVREGNRWISPEERAAAAEAGKADIRISLAEDAPADRTDSDAEAREKWLAEMQKIADEKAARYRAQAEAARNQVQTGVVLGPHGYGYYGVRTADGTYVPYVPAGGPVYYYTPYVVGPGTRDVRYVSPVYGWGVRYNDDHWSVRAGSGGWVIKYRK